MDPDAQELLFELRSRSNRLRHRREPVLPSSDTCTQSSLQAPVISSLLISFALRPPFRSARTPVKVSSGPMWASQLPLLTTLRRLSVVDSNQKAVMSLERV